MFMVRDPAVDPFKHLCGAAKAARAPVLYAMHPLDALRGFATSRHPDRELAPDVYLLHDSHTVTVFDKFPKGMSRHSGCLMFT